MPIWKDYDEVGLEHYLVGSNGEIINKKTGKTITQHTRSSDGRLYVTLIHSISKKHINIMVSRMVAKMFVPQPDDNKNNVVVHKDGNQKNNESENLCWRSRSYSYRYNQHERTAKSHLPKTITSKNYFDGDKPLVEYHKNIAMASMHFGLLPVDVIDALETGLSPYYAPNVYFEYA